MGRAKTYQRKVVAGVTASGVHKEANRKRLPSDFSGSKCETLWSHLHRINSTPTVPVLSDTLLLWIASLWRRRIIGPNKPLTLRNDFKTKDDFF